MTTVDNTPLTRADLPYITQEVREEVRSELQEYATKEDLRNELQNYATKEDLRNELQNYSAKEDPRNDLRHYDAKEDIANLRANMARMETRLVKWIVGSVFAATGIAVAVSMLVERLVG